MLNFCLLIFFGLSTCFGAAEPPVQFISEKPKRHYSVTLSPADAERIPSIISRVARRNKIAEENVIISWDYDNTLALSVNKRYIGKIASIAHFTDDLAFQTFQTRSRAFLEKIEHPQEEPFEKFYAIKTAEEYNNTPRDFRKIISHALKEALNPYTFPSGTTLKDVSLLQIIPLLKEKNMDMLVCSNGTEKPSKTFLQEQFLGKKMPWLHAPIYNDKAGTLYEAIADKKKGKILLVHVDDNKVLNRHKEDKPKNITTLLIHWKVPKKIGDIRVNKEIVDYAFDHLFSVSRTRSEPCISKDLLIKEKEALKTPSLSS